MNFEIIRVNPAVELPTYATPGSIGLDFQAAITEPITLYPGEFAKIPLGIKIHILDPLVGLFLFPRSGLGNKGYGMKNFTGVIDSDYQGELIFTCWNTNEEQLDKNAGSSGILKINPLDKICQGVFLPIIRPSFTEVEVFTSLSERAEGGLGSTEKKTF